MVDLLKDVFPDLYVLADDYCIIVSDWGVWLDGGWVWRFGWILGCVIYPIQNLKAVSCCRVI